MKDSFILRLNQLDTSYLILLCVLGIGCAAAIFSYTGLLAWLLRLVGWVLGGSIRKGFLLWELLFAWAT